MTKPKKAESKARRDAEPPVRVEFDYAEASMLVVTTNLLFGAAAGREGPDAEMTRTLEGLMNKLYAAEPRLKVDARRVETEMRSFLVDEAGDLDDDADEGDGAPLKGEKLLPVVVDAMEEGRAVSLLRRDCVLDFLPTGAGQIGDVAVAIGWSVAHSDYTVVRMDEMVGIRLDNPQARPADADPVAATLARLCPDPPGSGGDR